MFHRNLPLALFSPQKRRSVSLALVAALASILLVSCSSDASSESEANAIVAPVHTVDGSAIESIRDRAKSAASRVMTGATQLMERVRLSTPGGRARAAHADAQAFIKFFPPGNALPQVLESAIYQTFDAMSPAERAQLIWATTQLRSKPGRPLSERRALVVPVIEQFIDGAVLAAVPGEVYLSILRRIKEQLGCELNSQWIEDNLVAIDRHTDGNFVSSVVSTSERGCADRSFNEHRDYQQLADTLTERTDAIVAATRALFDSEPKIAARPDIQSCLGLSRPDTDLTLTLFCPVHVQYPEPGGAAPWSVAYLFGIDLGRGPHVGRTDLDLSFIGPVTRDQAATLATAFHSLKQEARRPSQEERLEEYKSGGAQQRERLHETFPQLSEPELDRLIGEMIAAAQTMDVYVEAFAD